MYPQDTYTYIWDICIVCVCGGVCISKLWPVFCYEWTNQHSHGNNTYGVNKLLAPCLGVQQLKWTRGTNWGMGLEIGEWEPEDVDTGILDGGLLLEASGVRRWLVLYGRKSILWQNAKHIYLFTFAARQTSEDRSHSAPTSQLTITPTVCILVHVQRSRLVLRHLPSVYSTRPTEYMKKQNEAQKCVFTY